MTIGASERGQTRGCRRGVGWSGAAAKTRAAGHDVSRLDYRHAGAAGRSAGRSCTSTSASGRARAATACATRCGSRWSSLSGWCDRRARSEEFDARLARAPDIRRRRGVELLAEELLPLWRTVRAGGRLPFDRLALCSTRRAACAAGLADWLLACCCAAVRWAAICVAMNGVTDSSGSRYRLPPHSPHREPFLPGTGTLDALIRDERAVHHLARGTSTHHALDVEDLNEPCNLHHWFALPRHKSA